MYKSFLSKTGDGFVIKKDENKRTGRLILPSKKINIYRIRGLSVFIGKNGKALKRIKYKAFSVFWLYRMLVIPLKYGENEAKKG